MKSIEIGKLVSNLEEKFDNLVKQGLEANKQKGEFIQLVDRIEGAKEFGAILINEFKGMMDKKVDEEIKE